MKLEVGLQITEKEYRALPYPSYSLLSSLAVIGPDALYGARVDIEDHDGIVIGSIADSLVTEHKLPDTLVVIEKKPGGKAVQAIKALAQYGLLPNSKDLLSVQNHQEVKDVCTKLEYYTGKSGKELIKVLKKYNKYAKAYNEHGDSALIASKYHVKTAEAIRDNVFLRYPFVKDPDKILGQVKLVGIVNGVEIKGMLDFIYINHENKTIVPFDLKTGFEKHHEFFAHGYLGWRYYLQASLYRNLLKQEIAKHPQLKGYHIDNFRFLYCGRQDKLPVIYKVTDKQHAAGYTGFVHEGISYPGIDELLEDYVYYKSKPNAVYRRGYDKLEVVFDDSYL
jgi:hypothetical protein